ncbi:MAG: adenylosuccinate synthetase [Aquaticitalea sp.]
MLNILTPLLLQKPFGSPNPSDNNPIDFSNPFNVIVFIILPILLVIFYFYWKRKQKRDRE